LAWPKVDVWLGGADIYHATNYFLAPTRTARRVLSIYDLAFMVAPELCSPKIAKVFAGHVSRFAREADAVIVCSESTRRDVLRCCDADPARVTVAYGAVDEDFRAVDRDEARCRVSARYALTKPYILSVGTLEPRKNLPVLLQAFARIAKEIPHTLVLAGGAGWNAGAIFETLSSLRLGDRIKRVGFVTSAEDLSALYSAADLFAFPSQYEGFGLPLLEAMTCGCPVVAADNSSIPEVTGDAASLCETDDIDAFAAALWSVLTDDIIRTRLIQAGHERVKYFSWRTCAEKTLAVYRKAVER